MSLSERAMNVSLHMSMWNGRRIDSTTAHEVLKERDAKSDAGEFRKLVVPPSSLRACVQAQGSARRVHYSWTLPWGKEGVRILTSSAFFDYSRAMQEVRSVCETHYQKFLDIYESLVAGAPARMGKLYRADDFPSLAILKTKFGFELNIMPVSESGDFRVEIGHGIEEEIRAQIESTQVDRLREAQREVWVRLLEPVAHLATMTRAPKKKLHESLIENVLTQARALPKLSLQADPQLEELCSMVETKFRGIQSRELSKSPRLRKATATEAEQALAKIEKAMAQFR